MVLQGGVLVFPERRARRPVFLLSRSIHSFTFGILAHKRPFQGSLPSADGLRIFLPPSRPIHMTHVTQVCDFIALLFYLQRRCRLSRALLYVCTSPWFPDVRAGCSLDCSCSGLTGQVLDCPICCEEYVDTNTLNSLRLDSYQPMNIITHL